MTQFVHYFGAEFYFGWNRVAEPWARTRDGIIPVRLFIALYVRIRRLMGLDRLVSAQATMNAIAVTMGTNKSRGSKILRELVTEALGHGKG